MSLLDEAEVILAALGIPIGQLTATRRAQAARAFSALAGLKPGDTWSQAQDMKTLTKTSKQILQFGRAHLGETRKDGTYDSVPKYDLKLLLAAQIVVAAANKAHANTNDSTRGYGIHPNAADLARSYGSERWDQSCTAFAASWPSLAEEIARNRDLKRIPIKVSDDVVLRFEPDAHNQLQKAVVEVFLPTFGQGAELLYVGDARDREKFKNPARLDELGMFSLGHEKLPDVVAYSSAKNWLFLIEAVTTVNPIDEIRRLTLERLLIGSCKAYRVYVTAFPDRATFRTFFAYVAWETEVWLADRPEHMVHFNGDKFLGPPAASMK